MSYKQAGEYYEGENSQSSANGCFLKVAEFAAGLEDYSQAIEIFEKIASYCLQNNILKFNAKGHFFKAGLCVLCTADLVTMEQKLASWKSEDVTFESSRECQFLSDILEAYTDQDLTKFADHLYNYDNISKFDAWQTSLLLKVKLALQAEIDEDA